MCVIHFWKHFDWCFYSVGWLNKHSWERLIFRLFLVEFMLETFELKYKLLYSSTTCNNFRFIGITLKTDNLEIILIKFDKVWFLFDLPTFVSFILIPVHDIQFRKWIKSQIWINVYIYCYNCFGIVYVILFFCNW